MDLNTHVEALRAHLLRTAAAGTEQTQQAARLLADTLEPAVRLTVTDALATMAAEITAAWDSGTVDILIRGRDPEVVVTPAPVTTASPDASAPTSEPAEDPDDPTAGQVARISLRLPEALKTRAEAAATTAGVSLNTWLVRAVTTGLQAPPTDTARHGLPRRMTGFARS
ncbi:toxin-antitoxin system HicB family antitoxin [Geodermatophilaceae bacterium NBWT11]|nr:toxin-antitoxin system HicB family antitoxin [Geodermatophilaceae bacterium NBWT11]